MRLVGCAVVLTLAAACAGPAPFADAGSDAVSDPVPSVEPSIRGVITAIEEGSLLVEENPADESGSAKAHVRLGPTTVIRSGSGTPATATDLKPGVSVSVWFEGPVAESYPVQAFGSTILIEGGTPIE